MKDFNFNSFISYLLSIVFLLFEKKVAFYWPLRVFLLKSYFLWTENYLIVRNFRFAWSLDNEILIKFRDLIFMRA